MSFETSTGSKELELFPALVVVLPQPLLDVDYFLPSEVEADDPFTDSVEPPVPFNLGVRVTNRGYGTAGNLHIVSGQPRIIENRQGLLIAFRLLGTSVDGQPVQPTLNAEFGTISSQGCGVAAWQMVTTLSGHFDTFDAEYVHAPDLGGQLTSLIREPVGNHVLVHEMLVDLPGRDSIKDFLAVTHDNNIGRCRGGTNDGGVCTTNDECLGGGFCEHHVPDQIFESNCGDLPVNEAAGVTTGVPTSTSPDVMLASDVITGWAFTRVPDPAEGLIPVAQVIRSDGKVLRPENFWISREQDTVNRTLYHYFVNVIDFDSTGSFTLRYQRPAADNLPPTTSIVFQDPSYGTSPKYITPDTQILFTATDDISGVASVEYRLDSDPNFHPAFPFKIPIGGPHLITFRSTDRAGNPEADKTANVVVDPDAPAIDPVTVVPTLIVPSAPPDAPAARETVLSVTAHDAVPDLTGAVDIARGAGGVFGSLPQIRSIPFTLQAGVARGIVWNGRNAAGVVVPAGTYTIRVTVNDPLGHAGVVYTGVEVREFVDQTPASAASSADQQVPDLRGNFLVWQDNRNGNWDVFALELSGGAAVDLTAGQPADQMKPATDGRYVVWQDRRNGNWDIFLYDRINLTTTLFATEIQDQENPVVAAPWVVWQEKRNGQYDIVARNIDTGETVEVSAGDTGSHDQIRPSISGTMVAFEDYRFGLGEIFVFDLRTRQERRVTNDVDNQTQPAIDGNTVVWVDQRNGNRDLYMFDLVSGSERRLTYTQTDESQPSLRGGRIAYVDYVAGLGDPAISIYDIGTRRALRITADPHRQEEPTGDGNRVAWQDDRTGRWQIMTAEVALNAVPLARTLGPGFNMVGITDSEAAAHPTGFALLTAWNSASGVIELQKFDPASGHLLSARIPEGGGAPQGDNFTVGAADAVIARAPITAQLQLAAPASCTGLAVSPGANYVSLPCVPPGFSAKDLIELLGISKISSISRYDSADGRWKALAVDGSRLAGEAFPIVAGEGYLIYAREAAGPVLP